MMSKTLLLSMAEDAPIVIWNADRTVGRRVTKTFEITVWPTRVAVRHYLYSAFLSRVQQPGSPPPIPYSTFQCAEPGIAHVYQTRMREQVATLMPQWVKTWQDKVRHQAEEKQGDTEFLGALTRDYRKGCAICQTDNITGRRVGADTRRLRCFDHVDTHCAFDHALING